MTTATLSAINKQDSGYETPVDSNNSSFGHGEKLDVMSDMTSGSTTADDAPTRNGYIPTSPDPCTGGGDDSQDVTKTSERHATKTRSESRVTFSDIESETPSTNASQIRVLVTDTNEVIQDFDISQPRPLRRTVSMESRDNPFLPDGELRRETEELLRRSKVVGNKFIVMTDSLDGRGDRRRTDEDVVAISEELIRATSLQPTQAALSNSVPSPPPPVNSRLDDGLLTGVDKTSGDERNDSAAATRVDKNKKKKKCCAIL